MLDLPRMRAVPALAVLLLCAPRSGHAEGERALGRLEQESVDEALAGMGLAVDPHPQGKTIREIHIVNQEVFSKRDWWFQFFNIFHRTTRPEILRRDLLVKPGQVYDPDLADETVRNLQPPVTPPPAGVFVPPELSSVVVILPVLSPQPGTVDLLVVTRDVWSLRFNTNFEFQQNTLSLLDTSLSENNLFGWRKYLSARFFMDLGKYRVGPTYYDPNIMGTRLTLLTYASLDYSRDTGNYEGNVERVTLAYPLFSLASRWGATVDVLHQNVVARQFLGTGLLPVAVPPPDGPPQPYIFRFQETFVDSSAVRQFGPQVIQRVTLGHRYDRRHPLALLEFTDAALAQPFLDAYAPVAETRSEIYVQYAMFVPRYGIYRDLDTFDLRENVRLGPAVTLRAAYGAPELGATFRTYPLSAAASWAVGARGGLGLLSAAVSSRVRDGSFIDQRFQGRAYAASPMLGRVVRLVADAEAQKVRADTQKTLFLLGGDTGLRGYAIGALAGTSVAVAHVELRSAPLAIRSQRVGGLLFYDVGDAASAFDRMYAKHDFGLGLRWLIPQLNSSVIRLDWAIATQRAPLTRPGLPGRVTAGFQQIF